MPLSFRLFSVRFSFVCFGIGLYFLAFRNFRGKDKLCKNGSIILKNVNDPDKKQYR